MAVYFLDSSAIVKRYRDEAGSVAILRLFASNDHLIASRLATVEVVAAFARRARKGTVPEDRVGEIAHALEIDFRELFEIIELEGPILLRSIDLVRTHGLRAADAIQLACALKPAAQLAGLSSLVLVSSDAELNAAAAREHLTVFDPTVAA